VLRLDHSGGEAVTPLGFGELRAEPIPAFRRPPTLDADLSGRLRFVSNLTN
jgi:hypothetical protein